MVCDLPEVATLSSSMRVLARVYAVVAQRCPVCLRGAMFGSLLTTNERCATCGHRFLREDGFFQGAMYVSYFAGVIEFAVLALVAYRWLAPVIGLGPSLTLAVIVHFALVPLLFRYSRVIWAHLNVATGAKGEALPPQ
jgi:uncharacterized protein (DUF983 family)